MGTKTPPQPQQQFITAMVPITTLYTASGIPVQIVNVNSNVENYKYNGKAARILGIAQIVLGIVIFILQIAVTTLQANEYQGWVGFWAPPIIILAGAFGIQSAKAEKQRIVAATLVLCILAALVSAATCVQGLTASLLTDTYVCQSVYDHNGNYLDYVCNIRPEALVGISLLGIMAIFGFLAMVVAIIAAAFCCHGCCDYSRQGVLQNQVAVPAGSEMPTTIHYTSNPVLPGEAGPLPEYSASSPQQVYKENEFF